MSLSSSINSRWKLCVIGSLSGCLILLFCLNQSSQNLRFSAAQSTLLELVPIDNAEVFRSTVLSDPPKPSLSLYLSLPPLPSTTNETHQSSNFSSISYEKQPNPTQISTAKPSIFLDEFRQHTNKSSTQKKCNMFVGKWVYHPDETPSYDTTKCPFVEEKMSCRKNGRPDFEYEKWRWEANDCNIPLFNGRDMLERLRNKRVVIVGDSLNRNMWESLACLLYSSCPSSRAEVHAESPVYKVFKAKDYNTIIEFHWSPFLIEFDKNHVSGKKVLVLDKLSPNSKLWRGADVMVFNSGHWWTHKGKFKKWDLIQNEGQLLEKMPVELAYDKGMKTWASWIENNVDTKKTSVFFRSISPQHTGRNQFCYNVTKPMIDESFINYFPKKLINVVQNVIKGMSKAQVQYLNITRLTEYRIDAHPSVYRSNWKWKIYTTKYKRLIPSYADCSHWCLPGLPDTWNRLLYASLFFDDPESTSRS